MLSLSAENSILRHLLMLTVIAVAMSPLSSLHPWIAGFGTFLVMTMVIGIIALRGNPRVTAICAAAAVLLSSTVCWSAGCDLSSSLALLVTTIGTVALGVLSAIVCTTSCRRLRKINDMELQQIELVRKVYDYDRQSCLSGELPILSPAGDPSLNGKPARQIESTDGPQHTVLSDSAGGAVLDPDVFDFAMLLLSMQHIGHRLSAQLELDALVTTILATAREVLRCQHAELHLWNARERRFTNASSGTESAAMGAARNHLVQEAPPSAAFDWVLQQHCILTRRDAIEGKLCLPNVDPSSLPTAVAPLLVSDELVAVLIVNEAQDDGPTFVRMLHILANHCALNLKNAQLFRAIDELARRDSLTGLLNHASFLEELERLIDECTSQRRPLTLIMSDLDHFKSFNDDHGHQAGDRVLQEVSCWWKAIMPDRSLLGRYGGEEFICALPGEPQERGQELAELLRTSLEANPVSYNGRLLHVTASFGVAELGKPATNATRLIRLADKALYRAKVDGRNRVETHDPARADIAAMNESTQFTLR